ncbi:MAG: hypothetical protein AB8B50_18400 [Pirellulaceae bacterium]
MSLNCVRDVILVLLLVQSQCTARPTDIGDLPLDDNSALADLLVAELLRYDQQFNSTVSLEANARGSFLDPTGDPFGSNSKVGKARKTSTKYRFKLIASDSKCFVDYKIGRTDATLTCSEGRSSKMLRGPKGRITNVFLDCKPPEAPLEMRTLCGLFGQTPFVKKNGVANDIDELVTVVRSLKFYEIRSSSEFGELLVMRVAEDLPQHQYVKFSDRYQEFCFASCQDYILPVTIAKHTEVGMPEGVGEASLIQCDDQIFEIGYESHDGIVGPQKWRNVVSSVYLTEDRKPVSDPKIYRDLSLRVSRFSVLEKVPNNILNVKIPDTAKIKNLCEAESFKAQQFVQQSAPTRNWLLLVGGAICCLTAFIVWKWQRRV